MNVTKPCSTGKTDCKAMINALKVEEKIQLTTVHNTHNHRLSLQKSCFFRCNREVSETVKRVLDTNDLADIRMNKSFRSLVVGVGRFENLPFLEKNCHNYIDKARHLRVGAGGAGVLRDYFCRMQYKNPGFFSLMDLDDDGRLKNVFWADPRSRAAYQHFGDVVTFNTSYLTNRYGMPFAPFVGVSHHGQSILLGAGLISSEDTKTFIWSFQTWLQCMDVSEKLGSHHAYKSGLKTQLMKCVYDTQTIEEFEKSWEELISTYNLQENVWLQSLYVERTHWVPVFLKEYFWAGMSTTQRRESMNTFFDGYVHAKTNLKEFVDQFDNALRKKIENEIREVQQQVMGVLDMDPSLLRRDGVKKTYLVEDEISVEEFTKHVTYYVDLNEEDCEVKCSCELFQMKGILCRHVLAIFKCNEIKYLPDRYILDRWRKDIKQRYTLIQRIYDIGNQREFTNRYSSLLNIYYRMITHTADSKEHTEDASTKLYAMIDLYHGIQEPLSMTQTNSNVGLTTKDTTTVGSSQQVLSPRVVHGKGRPPSLRSVSRMEQEMRKVKVRTKKSNVKGKCKEFRYL
ncbi:protein FAR1-RELATED SEQUENCE 5-like [Juglans microcarpa x Juglans regia]|uniref:protein FAR1-RELATED SEQUENCE 5-like n=1 Tax=Juglans microcarpa x Juglans regia TaxID=2249226 RepID=UPI001B7EB56F|nr:protein FAR1-RELATED SEQUENCE 5-like [Juglans microcarpa x Juglans regia]